MRSLFKADSFTIEYNETNVEPSVVWEHHCHAQFEMIGVLEGDVTISIEGIPQHLVQNQALIIPPLCYHTVTANQQGLYRRIMVWFETESIPTELRSLFSAASSVATFSTPHLERLQQICTEHPSSLYAPLVNAIMIQSFYDDIAARQSDVPLEADDFLKISISYIDTHLREKISIDDLAEMTSRSRSSFCHLFEKKMKIAPKQYILQKKMALANQLIDDGRLPTEVAATLGYENYSSFYRMYVKQYGVMPRNFSRHIQKSSRSVQKRSTSKQG